MAEYVISETEYRSNPSVNMNNDMVRVIIDLPIRKWQKLKGDIEFKTETVKGSKYDLLVMELNSVLNKYEGVI